MHLKRRLVSLLMASLLAATLSPMAHGYTDTENSWAAAIVEQARVYGLMEGYPDGRFGVGEDMTRAAFVTVLCRIFGWEPIAVPGETLSDVSHHWAKGYITPPRPTGLSTLPEPSAPMTPSAVWKWPAWRSAPWATVSSPRVLKTPRFPSPTSPRIGAW